MRDSRSVTTRPSGLESAIARVVSNRAARVGNCKRPKAKSNSPKAPQKASATIIQVMIVMPVALGASQRARTAPARASARTAKTRGFGVRSIRSTRGGGGVEFIGGSNPWDACLRERAESIAMWPVLARSPTDVSAGERPVGGQRGEGHSFQWDRILL